MTFLLSTRRPDSTEQTGVDTNTVIGGGTMHGAVADASDVTAIRLAARARLDNQVARLRVQAPVLAGTDRVHSVGVRARMKSVAAGTDIPLLLLWLRTESGQIVSAGEVPDVAKIPFEVYTPVDALSAAWADVNLGEITYAPGGLPWDQNGNLTSLSVELGRGDDHATTLDVAALYFDIYYQQISTVTVLGPVDGEDTRPPIVWDYDSPNYAPQQGYRWAVHTEAATLDVDFDPWVTPALYISGLPGADADTSWWLLGEDQRANLPGDLVDGTFVAFVQCTSQWAGGGGDFYTDTASITWIRDGSTASPPAAAVLTSVEYSYAEMRTLITITPGGPTDVYTVERRTAGAGPWSTAAPSLTHIPADGLNPIEVFDRFMPLNTLSEYRVIALAGSPLVAAQEPSNVESATPVDDRFILRHPTNDLLDVAITIKNPKAEEGIKRTKRQMQGTAYFTGGPGTRVLPVMTFGPTYGWEYDLTLLFKPLDDPDLWAKVDQLDEARCPLFFQLPTGGEQMWGGLGPGAAGRDTEEALTHVAGNRTKYLRILRKTTFTECVPPLVF